MDDNYDLKVCVEEAKRAFNKVDAGFDIIRDTARHLISVSSLVISLHGLISSFKPSIIPDQFNIMRVTIMIALYLAVMYISFKLLSPAKGYGPIDATWDELAEYFMTKDEIEVLRQQIANYVDVIPRNEAVLEKRVTLSKVAIFLQVLIVIIIVL